MSITAETAKAHANDPAVLCCRLLVGYAVVVDQLAHKDVGVLVGSPLA